MIGRSADWIIANGGSAILTEIPEIFGAEIELLNRCKSPEIFDELSNMINCFKDYFVSHNQKVFENPSPGNKDGGISTLEEKSLGAVQKGGISLVDGVIAYGEKIQNHGLNILNAPGNDAISSTALAAAGAHIILFSTGRGTPNGLPCANNKNFFK